jgi:hypothetical protein
LRSQLIQHIKGKLRAAAQVPADDNGYFRKPQDNLLPGVRLEQFEQDLRTGAGHELRSKFCAIHSSSALAVNTFAPFKDEPTDLMFLGRTGFGPPAFEHVLPTGLKGTPPTLDVFFRREDEAIAVESKFLEYFMPKKAEFSPSYKRKALPWVEGSWWRVVENAMQAGKRYLDVAQLAKHYFGLSRLLEFGDALGWKPEKATLLYLFWEPGNSTEIGVCVSHRREIEDLVAAVSGSKVAFRSLSYSELWQSWEKIPRLAEHAGHLKQKYLVEISPPC